MWDAIWCGVRQLELDREAIRKVMILMTDGVDNASRANESIATRAVRAAGVMVYTIGLETATVDFQHLRRLSESTGGRFFRLARGAPMAPIFTRIGDELRGQYAIAYDRSHSGPAQLKLLKPGLVLRMSSR